MGRVVHFEIQADDVDRAKNFYAKVLGWKTEVAMSKEKGDMMDYWMIMTGEGPGIDGGLYQRPEKPEEQYRLYDCTVQVDDLDKAVAAVKANGGKITMEKSEIPKVGWFASALDTEGNKFGLMQATDWKAK